MYMLAQVEEQLNKVSGEQNVIYELEVGSIGQEHVQYT